MSRCIPAVVSLWSRIGHIVITRGRVSRINLDEIRVGPAAFASHALFNYI